VRLHDFDSLAREITNLGTSIDKSVLPFVHLALWAQTRTEGEYLSLISPDPDRAQLWSAELVPSNILSSLRSVATSDARVALRVPLTVRTKGGTQRQTFFNLFLERSDLDSEKPLFIRDELIITDVKAPRSARVRALVIVEDQPLATLLRDAETPAHTQWNPTTGNFKNKYTYGTAVIDYVRFCVSELQRIVHQADERPDPYLTIDYFSIDARPEDLDDEAIPARKRRTKEHKGEETTTNNVEIRSRPVRFRIAKLVGGFSIRPGDPNVPPPELLEIRVGYDVRNGNPVKRYHPADFDVSAPPIRSNEGCRGVTVVTANENIFLIKIEDPDFNFNVTGFAKERDLYVRAISREAADAD